MIANQNLTPLGSRYVQRYIDDGITYAQLQVVLERGLITQDEFDQVTTDYPSPPHA